MNVPTTINVYFGNLTSITLKSGHLTQGDYGQRIRFADLDLPSSYEVYFSNVKAGGTAHPNIGDETGVDIPDENIAAGGTIYAWLFLHAGENDGRTMRTLIMPVDPASEHSTITPTPVQQNVIDQTIAALNAGVTAAEAAQSAIEDMSVSASTLSAGSSATVTKSVDPETGAVALAFGIPRGPQGETGADGQDGQDGKDGEDGVSPSVTVTDITGGHRITITDADGAHSFDVLDGQSGGVTDVQVDGTSVVTDGVANLPIAGTTLGLVRPFADRGIDITSNGRLQIATATQKQVKGGTHAWHPLVPVYQHESTFYGLAKAAGADMMDIANTTVGTYPETQKSAISQMLNAPVSVSGSTPSITAQPGVRYVCGEVSTLDITTPASGIVDVVFESGSTPTVLTVTPPTGVTAVLWPDGFDPTSLDANTVYEINILDGKLAEVGKWATT